MKLYYCYTGYFYFSYTKFHLEAAHMRSLIFAINITPDGFCDHRAVVADGGLQDFYTELLKNADTVLFGRKTFQLFESYWPGVARGTKGKAEEREFATIINKLPKIVFLHHSLSTYWANTIVQRTLDVNVLSDIKRRPGKDILLLGSPGIGEQLKKLDLIDKYYFVIQPLIAGRGKRLFESFELAKGSNLNMSEIKTFSSGAVAIGYGK